MSLNSSLNPSANVNELYSLIRNKVWIIINWIEEDSVAFIFKDKKNLIINRKGKVEETTWEYIGNDILIIKTNDKRYAFKIELRTDSILVFKFEGKNEFTILVNEPFFKQGITEADDVCKYLSESYLKEKSTISQNSNFQEVITKVASYLYHHNAYSSRRKDRLYAIWILVMIVISVLIALNKELN
ncbi:hypothetical protein [Rufibacter tibetensis]|uniref:Uncharacterized protein n=1 Tax=Rufibacter tibetensis TaxID=512763 RepID=A0A0P0C6W1_9BACT|nr:hypothetical protein [Rufibacter tibetensis]ALJ00765.1 hypothetical protein DC20_19470 [Rufibacter tibetensis]